MKGPIKRYIDRHVEAGLRYGPDDLFEGYTDGDEVVTFPIDPRELEASKNRHPSRGRDE